MSAWLGISGQRLVAQVTSSDAAAAVERLFSPAPVGWLRPREGGVVHVVGVKLVDVVRALNELRLDAPGGPSAHEVMRALPRLSSDPTLCGHCAHHHATGADCCGCGKQGARA